ncbi:peptide chain release factor-like protein [Candidatus Carsonella ruddii]|uniref:Peptide chain release factor B n=1 Tax=Candidatus Carsonella ruddii PC isolate NHV TaxID=1202540 RepID=J3VQX1_CARRU|nr:peptide chain release factor-like protein [Candidatus Carsonella ruddii]AFP84346.1 peptide chain release factor B [Candidatus Carsonella ruddii PC isolate NHV]
MIELYKKLTKNYYIKKKFIKKNILNYDSFILNCKDLINNLNIKFSESSCFIEIISNQGGIDTHSLNSFFLNFYYKWLLKNKFNVEIINLEKSLFGYKKSLLFVNDYYSFFLFKNESGLHRIIRKNPLVSSKKIQTSYLSFNILPKINSNKNFINKNDLIIENYKSKGSGGQHVNTTNSAIRIIHKPTNIIVSSQSERSQIQNKKFALQTLEYKLLVKNNLFLKERYNNFKYEKKYIKTYYFENNEIIDHVIKKKIDLIEYFNLNIDFIKI